MDSLVISKETIDSFVDSLSQKEGNVITREIKTNDSMTTISANYNIDEAIKKQNQLIELIKEATKQEEANLLMVANDFSEVDKDISEGF